MTTPSPHPASRGCAATTNKGPPCSNRALAQSDCCAFHDDEIGLEARRKGGQTRAAAVAPTLFTEEQATSLIRMQSAKDIPPTLETLARAIASGRLDVRIGNAITVCISTAIRAIDSGDLAKRIEHMETVLGPRMRAKR